MQALLSPGSIDLSRFQDASGIACPFDIDGFGQKRESIGISQDEVHSFAVECLEEHSVAMIRVNAWLRQGVAIETIYLQAIAPACHIFGKWWRDDTVDFASITLATWKLQQCLFELSPRFLESAGLNSNGYSALFLLASSTQHSIGAFMLGEFFRRYGWRLVQRCHESDAIVQRTVEAEWFDLVGYSLSCDRSVELVRSLIPKIRRHSANPNVQIMVGGPMVICNPSLAQEIGADLSGSDAIASERHAVECVRKAWSSPEPQKKLSAPHVSFAPKLYGSSFCGA